MTTTKEAGVEALSLMREIVAEKGEEYTYPADEKDFDNNCSCRYLTYEDGIPTGPSCLIGHYLVRRGVPIEEIAHLEGESAITAVDKLGVACTPGVSEALDRAQEVQDAGRTWGEALAVFERTLDHWACE